MKRLHLFEFEDLSGCPHWLRSVITDMLSLIHRWFGTADIIKAQLEPLLSQQQPTTITDLCSGSGGPMVEVVSQLRQQVVEQKSPESNSVANLEGQSIDSSPLADTQLRLTDLYPNAAAVASFQKSHAERPWVRFESDPVDAAAVRPIDDQDRAEVRTMICCFHHMPPVQARKILASAQSDRQPMLIFEMSDNSVPPKWLWWIAIFPNFFFGLLVAVFTRPMTPVRFLLSFLVPVIPICFAWDGAVSNIRTYIESDIQELLEPIKDDTYQWQVKCVQGKLMKHLVVIGTPIDSTKQP